MTAQTNTKETTAPRTCLSELLIRHEKAVVAFLLILAVTARLVAFTKLPADLNPDEASAGYEAWSLLHYGIDRSGNHWPVLLASWGSGQNILYTLLTIPFVAVLGLNMLSLRLPAFLCGVAAVVVFWRLARRCRGVLCGLCALLLAAVNPWHIMVSRWALECNIMPLFLLTGLFFTVKSRENVRWLFGAAVFFGLSLYAYGTAFFFLPFFLVIYVLLNRSLFRQKAFYLSILLFILLALPIGLCQYINMTDGEGFTILGFTITKLTEARQMDVSVFGSGLPGILENIRSFLNLLITQSDGWDYNALPVSGLYYFFGLPLAAAGFLRSIRRRIPVEMPMRLALCVAFLCACFISININRINMVWFPLLYFQAVGLESVLNHTGGNWVAVPIAGILLCFVVFLTDYGKGLAVQSNLDGLNEALTYAEDNFDGDIYVTRNLRAPYIYVLFVRQISPVVFTDTVYYSNPDGAFRDVVSFDRYRFDDWTQTAEPVCFIITRDELSILDTNRYSCKYEHGKYAVCVSK